MGSFVYVKRREREREREGGGERERGGERGERDSLVTIRI